MIAHIGIDVVIDSVSQIGLLFLASSSVHVAALVCDGIACKYAAGCDGTRVPVPIFARACIVAHAINNATPGNAIGEISRYSLLRSHLGSKRSLATVVLGLMYIWIANFTTVVVAGAVSLCAFDLDPAFLYAFETTAIVSLIGIVILLWAASYGVGDWFFRGLLFLRISASRVARIKQRWIDIEELWKEATSNRRRVLAGISVAILARVFTTLEAVIILGALGIEPLLPIAIFASAGLLVITWLTPFIPYQAGSAEGSAYLMFVAVGVAPHAGVVWELVRKARRILILLLGIVILGRQSFYKRLANHQE